MLIKQNENSYIVNDFLKLEVISNIRIIHRTTRFSEDKMILICFSDLCKALGYRDYKGQKNTKLKDVAKYFINKSDISEFPENYKQKWITLNPGYIFINKSDAVNFINKAHKDYRKRERVLNIVEGTYEN